MTDAAAAGNMMSASCSRAYTEDALRQYKRVIYFAIAAVLPFTGIHDTPFSHQKSWRPIKYRPEKALANKCCINADARL